MRSVNEHVNEIVNSTASIGQSGSLVAVGEVPRQPEHQYDRTDGKN